jgi:protocatechuate 3,4-dioxygenase beta subunit
MRRVFIVAGLLISVGLSYGQFMPRGQKNLPANAEQNAPPLTGKSTISGVVVNAKTHEPVKKAKVMINGAASLSAVTDAGGNFSFRALPPGMYWLMANHPDFSPGARRTRMAVNLNLADGEEKTGVEIALQPGASISGRVVNEDDQPVPNCSVTASRAGSKQFQPGSGYSVSFSTDTDGNYLIHGIEPGRYNVHARCGQSFPAPHGFMRVNDPDVPTEGYAPASYAGGGAAASGGLLVTAGADLSGIDFHVKRSRMFTVRANVSGVEGNILAGTQILMLSKDAQQDEEVGMPARYNGRRGFFVFRNVTPGSYEVLATVVQDDKAFEARQDIQVGESQETDVELKMAPGPSISGTVVTDDAGVQLEGQQISLQPLQPDYRGPSPVAVLTKDGTFEFKSVLPGHFSLNGLQGGFFKSVTLGGREVTPSDIEIGGEGGALHISLSSRFGKVHVNAESQPAAGEQAAAVLFPVAGGQPLVGSYGGGGAVDVEFDSVAPGKYRVLLVASDNPWMLANDPGAQKLFEDHMTQLTVAEASEQRVTAALLGRDELGKLLEATE